MEQDNRPAGARVTNEMVGSAIEHYRVAWTEKDTMLYALGVGAALGDPARDLGLVTENSEGVALKALPSFLSAMGLGQYPPGMAGLETQYFLHAEQGIELVRPLPPSGQGFLSIRIEEVLDKGSGAYLTTVTTLHADKNDAGNELGPIGHARSTIYVRGGGGFGGPRGSAPPSPFPDHEPDARIIHETRPEQALVYRLNGDRNPLHSDPTFARARGFERPILHGLCTYGFACRALVGAAGGDPDLLLAMNARFSKPVYPGGTLTTEIWFGEAGLLQFRVLDHLGDAVLDRGTARIAQ